MGREESYVRSKFYIYSLSIIVFSGLLIRFRNLDGPSLWLDELTILSWTKTETWEATMGPNNAGRVMFGLEGFFYYFWLNILGDSDFALRSISAFSGTALLIIIAEFARKEVGESVAIMSSGMLVASFLAVWYSQEGRIYMATTCLLWLSLLMMHNSTKNKAYQRICIISLLTFCYLVHWFSAIIVILGLASRWAQLLFRTRENSNFVSTFSIKNIRKSMAPKYGYVPMYVLSMVSLGIFCIPEMLESNSSSLFSWIPQTPDDPQIVLLDYMFGITSWTAGMPISWLSEALWWLILSSPFALFFHIRFFENEKLISQQPEWFLWSTGPLVLAIAVFFSEFSTPVFVPRYFLFSMPSWILLISISAYRWISICIELSDTIEKDVMKRIVSVFFTATILLLQSSWLIVGWDYYDREKKTDYENMAIELDEMKLGNDVVVVSSPGGYLWDIYLERQGSSERIDSSPSDAYPIINGTNPNSVIYLLGTNTNSVIDTDFDSYLDERYGLREIVTFHMGEIRIYGTPGDSS